MTASVLQLSTERIRYATSFRSRPAPFRDYNLPDLLDEALPLPPASRSHRNAPDRSDSRSHRRNGQHQHQVQHQCPPPHHWPSPRHRHRRALPSHSAMGALPPSVRCSPSARSNRCRGPRPAEARRFHRCARLSRWPNSPDAGDEPSSLTSCSRHFPALHRESRPRHPSSGRAHRGRRIPHRTGRPPRRWSGLRSPRNRCEW